MQLLAMRRGRSRVTHDSELICGDVGVDASEHISWEVRVSVDASVLLNERLQRHLIATSNVLVVQVGAESGRRKCRRVSNQERREWRMGLRWDVVMRRDSIV